MFIGFVFLSGIWACASPKTPTGGLRDETPPAIVDDLSTPNHQTHFKDKLITLTFDEWITLKDIYRQLVISPLMPAEPDVRQKGKAIIITLPDSLREETTYSLHFGNAIADLNEGNILENYSFVFSTGMVLDSAQLSGTVIDAVSLKPAEGIWVMLHSPNMDSAAYHQKPEYLAKTNKEGKWSIANIREDSFQVVALKDENLNFLYDQEAEWFGWHDEIVMTTQPLGIVPEIRVFPREMKYRIKEVLHPVPGWIKLVMQRPGAVPDLQWVPDLADTMSLMDKDTLHVWYPPGSPYTGRIIMAGDTTQIRRSAGQSILNTKITLSGQHVRLHPSDKATYTSALPLERIDTALMTLRHDSLGRIPFEIFPDRTDRRKFSVWAPWKENIKYELTLLPGALTDFWGRTHDTLRIPIVVNAAEQFGDLSLKVSGLDSLLQYLVWLKSGDKVIERFIVSGVDKTILMRPALPPGKYTVEMIEDLNRNGQWDTGDFHTRRHPERKKFFSPEQLRAGWELEADIIWSP